MFGIPVLWRYLIAQFLKVLLLCLLSFIGILLTIRMDEIAHFASLAPQKEKLALFILYQIPYILPITLPFSCLISALILLNNMSETEELTALRAAGYSFSTLFSPLILVSLALSLGNFFITSELATHSHLAANLIKQEIRNVNPLLLLNHKHLVQMKGIYFDTLGDSKLGEFAENTVIAVPHKTKEGIHLILAKKMQANSNLFLIENLTVITTLKKEENAPPYLLIENIGKTETSLQEFSKVFQPKTWTINNDHLNTSLLLARLKDTKENSETSSLPKKKKDAPANKILSEFVRRLSLAIGTFSFTLMGIAYGISSKRAPSYFGIVIVTAFAALTLISYFAAKALDHHLIAATLLYLTPHALILMISFRRFYVLS